MVKKLTEQEKRDRKVTTVVLKIRKFEKQHSEDIVKSACYRYNKAIQDRKSAEKDIKEAEERLDRAKRRLK